MDPFLFPSICKPRPRSPAGKCAKRLGSGLSERPVSCSLCRAAGPPSQRGTFPQGHPPSPCPGCSGFRAHPEARPSWLASSLPKLPPLLRMLPRRQHCVWLCRSVPRLKLDEREWAPGKGEHVPHPADRCFSTRCRASLGADVRPAPSPGAVQLRVH